jgi:hypothetical protein
MSMRPGVLVPERGGVLAEGSALDVVRRLPEGSCQVVYLDPPWHTAGDVEVKGAHGDRSGAYLRLLQDLLVHAKRVLAPSGNVFVYYPSQHPTVDLGAALGQVFGNELTFRITVPQRSSPAVAKGVPRSDTVTVFWARASADATYHPPLQPQAFESAVQQDDKGRYRLEEVEVRGAHRTSRSFEFEAVVPATGRAWRFSQERMTELFAEGRLVRTAAGRWRLKRYEHELPPAEVPLEWTDLTTLLPLAEREVPGLGPHRGPQEPLALMRRIVEMASDPGDLVAALSFGGAGTGALASHQLGRRWVANTDPGPIADWVRARLVTKGSVEDQDFTILRAPDTVTLPVQQVEDVPLLFTAEQMRASARHAATLRALAARSFDDAAERGLAEHLLLHGVIAVHGFHPPGSQVEIDVFLPGPPFGVVEVKSGGPSRTAAIEKLVRAGTHLSADTRLYLILQGVTDRPASAEIDHETGVVVVHAGEGDWAGAAKLVADDHTACRQRLGRVDNSPSDFLVDLAGDDDELTRQLSYLTMNLDPLFLAEGRAVLEHEISHLRNEIGHGHFTAAALRVGRSLEFIIYEACRSWGVEVRKPILVGLTKLDNRKDELASKLIAYANSDTDIGGDDAVRVKNAVVDAANKLQSTVLEIIFDVDMSTATDKHKEQPTRNLQALINDIAKTYRHLDEVGAAKEQIDAPVKQLLKLRNAAAHASTDGAAREVSREELREMLEYLNSALLGLSRCGTAILASRSGGPA